MVGGVHVGIQREGALPLTVVGGIAFGCDDPVLRGEIREHEEAWSGEGRGQNKVGMAGSHPPGRNPPPAIGSHQWDKSKPLSSKDPSGCN